MLASDAAQQQLGRLPAEVVDRLRYDGQRRAQPGRPIRVNLVAAGFVDTPLSATLLGTELDARREQLRSTLPIGRVVGPEDVAAVAIHLMINTAVTGATYDVDGGQPLLWDPPAREPTGIDRPHRW